MPGIILFRGLVLLTKPLMGRLGLSQRLASVRIIRIQFKNTHVTPTRGVAAGTDIRPIPLDGMVNRNFAGTPQRGTIKLIRRGLDIRPWLCQDARLSLGVLTADDSFVLVIHVFTPE